MKEFKSFNGFGVKDAIARKGLEALQKTVEGLIAGGNTGIVVDGELSETSTNPVQNKIIYAKIQELLDEISNNSCICDTEQMDSIQNSIDELNQVIEELQNSSGGCTCFNETITVSDFLALDGSSLGVEGFVNFQRIGDIVTVNIGVRNPEGVYDYENIIESRDNYSLPSWAKPYGVDTGTIIGEAVTGDTTSMQSSMKATITYASSSQIGLTIYARRSPSGLITGSLVYKGVDM